MATYQAPKGKPGYEETHETRPLKIRITLTSCHKDSVEKVCANIISKASTQRIVARGPIRLPRKINSITTRRTPNGEGSKTWDRYQMRIYKRLIDLVAPSEVVKQITSTSLDPKVEVEVTIQT